MDPLTVLFSLTCIGVGGGVGYWLKKADDKFILLNETGILLQESQAANYSHLNSEIGALQDSVGDMLGLIDALRATNPELDGAILSHATITRLENLGEFANQEEIDIAIGDSLHCIETLVATVSSDTVVGSESVLNSTSESLVTRLLNLFVSKNVTLDQLGMNSLSAHKLGHVAMSLRQYEWAESAFGLAYQASPGNSNLLEALEKIAIIKSDPVLRRHWLEARMTVTPDDPELLRSHAHLLASLGDEEAERDVRRLEALGLDTAADRSLLSGLRARAGARSEALEAIENALAEDPSVANDWYSHAKLLYQGEELGKALTSVDRCLELDRQHGEAWALMAILLAPNKNRLKEALKAATHAVALDSGGVELMMLKVDLLFASDSPSDAEKAMKKVLENHPQNGELRAIIASRKLLEGDFIEAQKLLDETPVGIDHTLLHVVEGRLHLANADRARDGTGQTDAVLLSNAFAAFDEALKLDRESGVAWLGLARSNRLLQKFKEAEESLDRARRLLPESDPSASIESALLSLDNGDISAASTFIDAADIYGENATISYVRGNIAARCGHLEQALNHYTEALEYDAGHIRARLNRCSVLMALNEPMKALDDSEILLDLAPNLTLARLRRAEAAMMLGEWEPARDDLKMVLENAPHHHHALTQLASCHMSLKRPERAEAPLNEALRLVPDHAPAWHQRGLLYLDWGREEAALSDFEAAVRCDSQHLDARLHIAALHHEAKRLDQASAAWKSVLAIDADCQVARTRLEECEIAQLAATN
jgi:tetratricopeptide (TPR) repeat protein